MQKLMLQIGLIDKMTKPMKEINKQIRGLQNTGMRLAAVGYASLQMIAPAVQVEEKMKTLRVEGADSADDLLKSAMTLNKTLTGGLPDAIDLLQQTQNLTKLTGAELQHAALATSQLSQKFPQLDQTEILKSQTSLMRSFGASVFETSDALAFLAKQGGDLSGEMLASLNEYAPQMKGLGFSFQKTVHLAQSAMSQGWNMDKGLDAFKEFHLKINELGKSQQTALQQLGLSDVMEQMNAGEMTGFEALQKISKAIPQIQNTTDQYRILQSLFGTPMEDIGLDPMLQMLQSIHQNIPDTQGEFSKLQNVLSSGFMPQWQKLKGAFQNVWVLMSLQVLPIFAKVAGGVAWLVEKIENLTKRFPNLTKYIGLGVVAVVALFLTLTTLSATVAMAKISFWSFYLAISKVYALSGLKFLFVSMIGLVKLWRSGILLATLQAKIFNLAIMAQSVALKIWSGAMFIAGGFLKVLTVGVRLLNLALFSSPIGAIIASVALLAVGVHFLVQKFGGWAKIWQVIQDYAGQFFNWIDQKIKDLLNFFDKIKNPFDAISGFFGFSDDLKVKKQVAVQAAPQRNQMLSNAVQNVANSSNRYNNQSLVNISTNQKLTQEDVKHWAFDNQAF